MQMLCRSDQDETMGIVHCVSSTRPQVAAIAGELLTVEMCDEEAMWLNEAVAQAQRGDPDIGLVVEQLSRAWKKPTTEELQPI